ncbi:MAG: SIMPL domain-containing protein [Nitrososphaeria archaeon]
MNKEQKIITLGITALTLILISTSLYALLANTSTTNTNNTPLEHTISVTGVGEIKVYPDTVRISLGALTEAPTTVDAVTKNSGIINELMKRLETMGVSKRDVQTTYYNIYPLYKYPNDGSTPYIIGYRVVHNLDVVLKGDDVAQLGLKAGKVIDESVLVGVNQVTSVQFTVSDQLAKQLKEQTLQLAIQEATSKANLTAITLGVKIVGVQSVTEESPVTYPIYYRTDAKEGANTILIPGQVSISTSIHIVYIIS